MLIRDANNLFTFSFQILQKSNFCSEKEKFFVFLLLQKSFQKYSTKIYAEKQI